jgi:hypothetical protein
MIVPTLQRGNAVPDAPASRNAGALRPEFPRRSVGTIKKRIQLIEQQKQQAQASLEKSEALFNSQLQRAFTGELTGNDKMLKLLTCIPNTI